MLFKLCHSRWPNVGCKESVLKSLCEWPPDTGAVLTQPYEFAIRRVWSGPTFTSAAALLRYLLKVPQIRWRLIFLGRHQQAVGAEKVVLLTNDDLIVALGA